MRILVGYLLLAISGLLVAQTSPEFHSRYGEPDRERFMARPGISLSVEYGTDGLVCQVLLESPRSLFNQEERDGPLGHVRDPGVQKQDDGRSSAKLQSRHQIKHVPRILPQRTS